ncbi:MAG: hypothetical protein WKF61_00455 [Luteimonas sp.]
MSQRSTRLYWDLVADRLETDASGTLLRRGQVQLEQWRRARPGAASERYWAQWDTLIAQGVRVVVTALRGTSEESDTLRSCAPFLGVVTNQERWNLLREH